ncbi:MAG: oxidoreductase [Actinobacteria bacterium]|nr:oxidoreductase [Actinomycetota bacterium]
MYVLLRQLSRIRRDADISVPKRRISAAMRHVDSGSCNGCEQELEALSNPFYDLQRYGITMVASPRHADILVVTGTVTTRMEGPLRLAYGAMPEPRIVAAIGNCAIGAGVIGEAECLVGDVSMVLPVDIRIPGCPPTPDAIASALLRALGESSTSLPR